MWQESPCEKMKSQRNGNLHTFVLGWTETGHCGKVNYRRRLEWAVNCFNKACRYRFSWLWLLIKECGFPPGTEKAFFTWVYRSCFWEEKGRAECPSYSCCVFKHFQLKILLMPKWHILPPLDSSARRLRSHSIYSISGIYVYLAEAVNDFEKKLCIFRTFLVR